MADPWSELAQARLFVRPEGVTKNAYTKYLDTEIQSLELVLARAKELRNGENILLSLPQELLLQIMQSRRGIALSDAERDRPVIWENRRRECMRCKPGPRHVWTTIACVCRRLRDIARAPTLSSEVTDITLPPVLIERVLAHSGDVPLHITLSHNATGMSHSAGSAEAIEYITRVRHRVQSLTVVRPRHDDLEALQLLGHLKHSLTLLHLRIDEYEGAGGIDTVDSRPVLVPIDSTETPIDDWAPPPALKSLYISHTPFLWNCPIYDNLTDLTLAALAFHINDLLDLFSRMSTNAVIERIALDYVILEYDIRVDDMFRSERNWRKQDRLRLKFEQGLAAREMHRLRIPSSLKSWRISLYKPSSLLMFLLPSSSISYDVNVLDPSTWSNVFRSCLTTHYPTLNKHEKSEAGPQLSPILAMHISIQHPVKWKTSRWQATTSFFRRTDAPYPDVTLRTTLGDSCDNPYNFSDLILGDFVKEGFKHIWDDEDAGDEANEVDYGPYLGAVRELSIDCSRIYNSDQWARLFHLFTSLVTLNVPEDLLVYVLPALEQVDAERRPDPSCIQALRVRESDQYYGFKPTRRAADTLVNWLSVRKDAGFPLQELRVHYALAEQMDLADKERDDGGDGWRSQLAGAV